MNKIILSILFLMPITAYASPIIYGTTYNPTGTVTSANLNGNFTNVSQVVNGGLDNTNANTTQGYRFYQTVAVLPSPGNQGAVYFLTTDNTLNFDNGGSFTKSVTTGTSSPSAGDILYYNGASWVSLAKGSTSQLLASGTTPSWGYTVGTSTNNVVQLDGSSKLPAVDGSNLTNLSQVTLGSILDYGTSSSVSTSKNQTALKIAYGNISVANKSSTSITNLPFSSSTSYKCTANQVAGTLALMNGPAAISYTSGSQVNIQNASDTTFTESWICIGS